MAGNPRLSSQPVDLAARVRQGDPQAEEQLAAFFQPRAFAMALSRSRDRDVAQDVSQEALLALLVAVRNNTVRDADHLAGFLHGIVRNLLNNHHRRRATQPSFESLDVDSLQAAPRGDQDETERRELVRRGLERLAAADRQILLLTLVEGCTPGEIAGRLGLKPDVVRARKSRALKRIIDQVDRLSRP